MLCFHVNQARFMVSAEHFNKVLFLTYNVRSYEHDREHVATFLNPYTRNGDYIYHLAHYILAAGFRFDNVDQFTKLIGIVVKMDWIATPPPITVMSLNNSPSPHSALQLLPTRTQLCIIYLVCAYHHR